VHGKDSHRSRLLVQSMRGFYEGKMKQMETSLKERESEREQLLRELEEVKQSDVSSKELQIRLQVKDEHIAGLRKKHRQLADLTAVSARNHAEISRLQSDVKEMKRKKVDLQKVLTRERKDHAVELKRLQQEAIQKDREVNRWKNVSTKREEEARRANYIAKTRLEELGQLRTKYKDTEKRLRLLSVKRSVMAKAGLDPVIVGRRSSQRASPQSQAVTVDELEAQQTSGGSPNADFLRDYFDQKVAEVVRKEALADKLAHEWEEHFDLTTRIEQLKEETDTESNEESVQSLAIQLHFKEDRIRRLAHRLASHKGDAKEKNDSSANVESFLYSEQFVKACEGTVPLFVPPVSFLHCS
jgi:hypothetical protein